MATFSENFLRAYNVAAGVKSQRERDQLLKEQQALHRQQVITQLQRQAEDDKVQQIARQQQDVLAQLKLSEMASRPSVPAGDGVGPPAPAEVQPLQFPTYGGGKVNVTPRFREDVLEQERARKEMEVATEVEKARQIAPIQAAAQAEANKIQLPDNLARQLGLPPGALPKEVVNTAETVFQQQQANRRQADEIAARAKASKEDEVSDGEIAYLADQTIKRNFDPRTVRKATQERILAHIGKQGLQVPRALTDRERKIATTAQTGLFAIMDMERLYASDPTVSKASNVPTQLGKRVAGELTGTPTLEFDAARKRAMDPELRAATGAALNQTEQKFYRELEDTLFDDPATIKYKFTQLKALYAGLSGVPVTIKMPDGKTFTVQDTYNLTQQFKMRQAILRGGEPLF